MFKICPCSVACVPPLVFHAPGLPSKPRRIGSLLDIGADSEPLGSMQEQRHVGHDTDAVADKEDENEVDWGGSFLQPIKSATVSFIASNKEGVGAGPTTADKFTRGQKRDKIRLRDKLRATDSPPSQPGRGGPREKPAKLYKFKAKTMFVLSQEFYDHNASLQNDLVGPFKV